MNQNPKKLLLLGGSRYLVPIIEAAHKLGLYVITCDYLPDNIAHKYSDYYCNVSIIDKDAVLKAAKELKIDGVLSHACDPGVVAAAYTAEQMGLPFQCSYEVACLLQDKGRFRQFLTEHNFNCPHAKSYSDLNALRKDIDFFTWPVIVKPVDSAGSKGVSKVCTPDELPKAAENALKHSRAGRFIVEDFLECTRYITDPFTIGGKLHAVSFSDVLCDEEASNPFTPSGATFPTTMKQSHQEQLTGEIQRFMNLLGMKNGIYDVEVCVSKNVPYIMEVSPRAGGCKISELQEMACGGNLTENEIRSAVGMPLTAVETHPEVGAWGLMMIHARPGKYGKYVRLDIREDIRKKNVKLIDVTLERGAEVLPYTGANCSLGDMFLHFDTREELEEAIRNNAEWLDIVLE